MGLIPGRGAKIPHAPGPKNPKQNRSDVVNKLNKDLKKKKWSTLKKKNIKKKSKKKNSSCNSETA